MCYVGDHTHLTHYFLLEAVVLSWCSKPLLAMHPAIPAASTGARDGEPAGPVCADDPVAVQPGRQEWELSRVRAQSDGPGHGGVGCCLRPCRPTRG